MKLITKSRKLLLSLVSAIALLAGVASASAATFVIIQQPKCPEHLLK